MAQVRIKLLHEILWRDKPPFSTESQVAYARKCMARGYTILPRMDTPEEGEAAAEAMFDLTNNPNRQIERLHRYGNGRSVSSGDIVEVDGVNYLCCSIGWVVLT